MDMEIEMFAQKHNKTCHNQKKPVFSQYNYTAGSPVGEVQCTRHNSLHLWTKRHDSNFDIDIYNI